jgi:HEPN domain-containing protein
MPPEKSESDRIARWLEIVDEDLLMASKGLEPPLAIGGAVYHCQQAAEKVLKTYLISSGQEFPRTHDLLALVQRCENIDSDFRELRPIAEYLTPFASHTRYPEFGSFPSLKEAQLALEHAQHAAQFVRDRLD